MDDKTALRKIAIELQAVDSKDVVKVAGILRRFKNLWKRLLSPDYRDALAKIRQQSEGAKGIVYSLNKSLKGLSSAIKDGDVNAYNKYLEDVKSFIKELWLEIGHVEENTNRMVFFTLQEMQQPGFVDRFSKYLPGEYDIELGKTYRKPLKSFSWYSELTPANINIRTSTQGSNVLTFLRNKIKDVLVTKMGQKPDEVDSYLSGSTFNQIVELFKSAIVDGLLLDVKPRKPHGMMKNVPMGETSITVMSAPFKLPNQSVSIQALTQLADSRTSVKPLSMLTVQQVTNIYIVSTASRIDELVKLAGVDFGASKRLGGDFWAEFVKMSNRLGAKPEDLASIIYNESAFDPKAVNIKNGRPVAKGLNQLILKTAKAFGMTEDEWARYENVPAKGQLEYVEKYFNGVGKATGVSEWESATQLYVANFAPKYIPKANDPSAVLYPKYRKDGSVNPNYVQNSGLDKDKKGFITVGDLAVHAGRKLPDHILMAIDDAKKVAGVGGEKERVEVGELDALIKKLYSQDDGVLTKMVKNGALRSLLPTTDMLIVLNSDNVNMSDKVEYARVAANALRRFADADTSIHCSAKKENRVDVQCSIVGSERAVVGAVDGICAMVSASMKKAVNSDIKPVLLPGFVSEYEQIECSDLLKNRRKFGLKRAVGVSDA
jgi:hypothetical protein